jgi:hypothetical protein
MVINVKVQDFSFRKVEGVLLAFEVNGYNNGSRATEKCLNKPVLVS